MKLRFNKIFRFFSWTKEIDPSLIEARKLPKTIPKDLRIIIKQLSNFDRRSETLLISDSSITTTLTASNFLAIATFPIKFSVMEEILVMLKTKNFSSIKICDEIRLDYPSHSISLEWGNYYLSKGESQTYYIAEQWEEIYMDCNFQLLKILRQALKKHTIPITVSIDNLFLLENDSFSISCVNTLTQYYFQSKNSVWQSSLNSIVNNNYPETIQILPGYTILKIIWHQALGKSESVQTIKFPIGNYTSGAISIYSEHNQLRSKTILQ